MRIMRVLLVFAVVLLFAGCDKMEDPKDVNKELSRQNEEHGDKHGSSDNGSKGDDSYAHPDASGDKNTEGLMKDADETYGKYKEDDSDGNKEAALKKNYEAAMYFMYDANLPPKDKYRPALKLFRRVLAMDPNYEEAKINKDKIEEIYEMMGKPIPETEL